MGDVATVRPLTASQQLRKVRKPLIERKRRERINGCLNELKTLVLEALNKDEAQFSKLEKADILELALEVLRTKPSTGTPPSPSPSPACLPPPPPPPTTTLLTPTDASAIASKYTAGFSQCALEVARCLGSIDGVQPEVRVHLTEHLASCVQKLAKLANSVVSPTTMTSSSPSPPPLRDVDASVCCQKTISPSPIAPRLQQHQLTCSPSLTAIPVTSAISVYPAHFVTTSSSHQSQQGGPTLVMVTQGPPVAGGGDQRSQAAGPQIGVVHPYQQQQQQQPVAVYSAAPQSTVLLKTHAIQPSVPSAAAAEVVQLTATDVWRPWH